MDKKFDASGREFMMYCHNCGIQQSESDIFCPSCGTKSVKETKPSETPAASYVPPAPRKPSPYVAAWLAFFVGSLGIHNFYLRNTKRAAIQLAVSLGGSIITLGLSSFAIAIWAYLEAMQLLSQSDTNC